jgi:hypothetical protein
MNYPVHGNPVSETAYNNKIHGHVFLMVLVIISDFFSKKH